MKKKDVLFLCQFFYPEYISSATLPYDTAEALVEAGYTVGALCGYPKEYSQNSKVLKKETANGISIKRLKYLEFSRKRKIGRAINYLSFMLSAFLHIFDLKNYRLVFVYSNPPLAPLLAYLGKLLFGTKFVFVAYDLYPEIAIRTQVISSGGFVAKAMIFVNRKVFRYADGVVALSNDMKGYISKSRHIPLKRIAVIPNWYEDISDQYLCLKDSSFIEPFKDKFIVSYLGNMGTCQDMDTLVDCIVELRNHDDIIFLLAGHGNKVEQIKKVIADKKLTNVKMFDFLHGDDYHDALRISDCAVVSLEKGITSLCSPSKAYGYMMAGNALIAIMDKCEITEEIDDSKLGFSVRNGNYKELARGILGLYKDRDMLETMKKNSVKLFKEKYTTEISTQRYVKLVSHILK